MKRLILLTVTLFLLAALAVAQEYGTFTDRRDGKSYRTIVIGTQIWMADNLAWRSPKECYNYNNEGIPNANGYLYLWETARNACPLGWHLPSDQEWQELVDYLGGDSTAGGKMKEAGTEHWLAPNKAATNQSGFSALPAGNRSSFDGAYYGRGKYTFWWTDTEFKKTGEVYVRGVDYLKPMVSKSCNNREFGYSVRCIKD